MILDCRVVFPVLLFLPLGVLAQVSAQLTEDVWINFPQADSTYIEVAYSQDTLYFHRTFYDLLVGIPFEFSQPVDSMCIQFELGFSQYTIDDSPAAELDFSEWTPWMTWDRMQLPDYYGNTRGIQVHQVLGFANRDSLAADVFMRNKEVVKAQSLAEQERMFSLVLQDSAMQVCCPGYMVQAQTFFSTPEEALNSIQSLALNFTYKTTVLTVFLGVSNDS